MDFTLGDFLLINNCHFIFHGRPENLDQEIAGVSIDSRTIHEHEVFFAIRGETHNGHKFVQDVFKKNAAAAVVEKKWWKRCPPELKKQNIFVGENSLTALQEAAHFYRKKFELPVIGLTGTNGKTTTKEMMAAVLSTNRSICKTEGNLNNHIGVPLTLFTLRNNHQVLILEMGANHFGEIARLCEISDPRFGLITNIGHGHLEFFGDLEGVAKAKMELFNYIKSAGTAFVNVDDPWIQKYSAKMKNKVTYGFRDEARVFGEYLGSDKLGFPSFRVQNVEIKLNLPGPHNLSNALAAVAVGLEFGITLDKIKIALQNVKLPSKRMECLKRNNITILNDSYNANPDSTKAALEVLSKMKSSGKKICVFGDMLELGDLALKEHEKVGESLKDYAVNVLLAYGPNSAAAVQAVKKAKSKIFAQHFANKNDLVLILKEMLQEGDVLLIKGSRGMKMEEILDRLF